LDAARSPKFRFLTIRIRTFTTCSPARALKFRIFDNNPEGSVVKFTSIYAYLFLARAPKFRIFLQIQRVGSQIQTVSCSLAVPRTCSKIPFFFTIPEGSVVKFKVPRAPTLRFYDVILAPSHAAAAE
jgi:hypothetical protein